MMYLFRDARGSRALLLRSLLGIIFVSMTFSLASRGLSDQTPPSAVKQPKAASPTHSIEQTIAEVISVVENLPGDEMKESRRLKLREVIAPLFNFDEMARRSLGANWRECTPTQQRDFVDVFSELLASTYLARIENLKRDMVQYRGETVDGGRALVRTSVTSKSDTFPIDYRLSLDGSNWRVYDVIIENVGLVANYRNEFAGIIRKERIDGLIEKLRAKTTKG